jgi:hypothetical protein
MGVYNKNLSGKFPGVFSFLPKVHFLEFEDLVGI